MPKFEENWDASRGDILYGFSEDRDKYTPRVSASASGSWYIMDQYNNAILPGAKQFGNSYSKKTPDVATVAGSKVAQLKGHNPATAYVDYMKSAPKGPFNLVDAKYPGKAEPSGDSRYSNMIRKACKHGIGFVLRDGAVSHLHFVLDKLSLDGFSKVQTKAIEHGYTAYTYSELRYVYKNWDKLQATGRIHFYIQFEEVPAPWLATPWTLTNSNPHKPPKEEAKA